MKTFIKFFATACGIGYAPFAPGTFGTVVGIVLYASLYKLSLFHYVLFLIVFIAFSVWVASRAESIFGEKDPSKVVIDEVAGILVTLAGAPFNWKNLLIGFIAFRFFDILKPFPIRKIDEKVGGGFGIVFDDVVAGIYGLILLQIIVRFL